MLKVFCFIFKITLSRQVSKSVLYRLTVKVTLAKVAEVAWLVQSWCKFSFVICNGIWLVNFKLKYYFWTSFSYKNNWYVNEISLFNFLHNQVSYINVCYVIMLLLFTCRNRNFG